MLQRKVTPADMIALRQIAAGELLYLTLMTAYTLDGIERVVEIDGRSPRPTDQERAQILESSPEFGKLRADHKLNLIQELGADFAAAWKWMVANQNTLCRPHRFQDEKIRKGELFDQGICTSVRSEDEKNLALIDQAIKGTTGLTLRLSETALVKKNVNVFAPIRNPVKDLKTLLPSSYNACGQATESKDRTFGGLFPDGDVAEFFEANKSQADCR